MVDAEFQGLCVKFVAGDHRDAGMKFFVYTSTSAARRLSFTSRCNSSISFLCTHGATSAVLSMAYRILVGVFARTRQLC